MRKGSKIFAFGVIAALFTFSFALRPCFAKKKEGVVKIGGLFCLTGFGSAAETYIQQGAKIAQEWYNEKGGITIKGKKYKIKLISEDIKGTANGTVAAANALLYDHHVKFVIGPVVPFMIEAAGSVLEPAKVLRVSIYNCDMPAEYGPKTPYTFVCQDASIEGMEGSLKYLKQAYPKVKTISYIVPNDGSVPYLGAQFTKKANALGFKVASIVDWAMTTQDFTPIVMKVLRAKPDAIAIANGWPQASGSMLKIARDMGFKGPMFGCNYDDGHQVIQIAGKDAATNFFNHGLVLTSSKMTPMIKMIIKRANKQFGVTYDTTVWGFQAMYVLVQAIEKAQSLDPTVVKNTWGKMKTINTVYGLGRMGGLKTYGINHTVCHPIPIQALQNGKVKWVEWMKVYSN